MNKTVAKVYMPQHVEECVRYLHAHDATCTFSGMLIRLVTEGLLREHARGRLPSELLGPARALLAPPTPEGADAALAGAGRAHSASGTDEVPAAQSARGYGQVCDEF